MDDDYDTIMSPLDEIKPSILVKHRNSSPGVRPRSNFPRRSCDGHFAFLSSSSNGHDRSPGSRSPSLSPKPTSRLHHQPSPNHHLNYYSHVNKPVVSPFPNMSTINNNNNHAHHNGMNNGNILGTDYHAHHLNSNHNHHQLANDYGNHRSDQSIPFTPNQLQRPFRPRVNTLPDALSGIVPLELRERDRDKREQRARSQSYTPTPSNGLVNSSTNSASSNANRRRRRSQERILETDTWNNYRKRSIDPRKFSISDTSDYYEIDRGDDSMYRILVLGADRVGKSSLLRQLIREEEIDKFSQNERNVKMLLQIEDRDVSIVFDNQPFQDDLLSNRNNHEKIYYHSVIVVYSMIDRRSFEISAQLLTMTIFDYKRINPDLKVCLIGNKSDLVRARAVDKSEGISLANRFEVDFFEASIELEDNLEEILTWISDNVRQHFGISSPSTNHSHGKFCRALSYMKKVLRKNDRSINSCEAVNAI
ncbi:uncharacterized protein LOC141851836 [Brevipalpus obovatus]|uniref:uncharacterized protein LOC141851836 n=1 Tax=Brevipalpus obovatus TaxID=246614 RepID=UPI003D9EC547